MKIDDGSGLPVLKANPISLVAVLQYSGKVIDPSGKLGLDPKKFYGVYRPEWELFDPKAMESFNGVPLIEDHEMVGEGGTKIDNRPADGCIMNVRPSRDLQGVLIADFKIYTESIMEKIKSGKNQLSLGYRCRFVPQKGEYNGVPYEFVQTHLRGNHIALVKRGRCGSGVRVYDADDAITCDSLEEVQKMTDEETKKQETQTALDSLAEALSGANTELACDVLEFVKAWKPKGTATTDGGEPKNKDGEQKGEEGKEKKPDGEQTVEVPKKDGEGAEVPPKKDGEQTAATDGGKEVCPKCGKVHAADCKDCEDKGKTKKDGEGEATATGDEAEHAKALEAGDALAKQLESELGAFDHFEMDEAAVANYACEKLGVAFDSAEEKLAFAKGYASMLSHKSEEKTTVVSAGDSSEEKSEAARTASCREAYLGN